MINYLTDIFNLNANLIAYKINGESITYKELLNKVLYFSDLLKRQGNEPVLIYGHKSINMIISMLSCIFANRTYIPIDTYTPILRINKIIDLTKASLIIKNEEINIDNSIEKLTLDDLNKYKNIDYKRLNNNGVVYIIFTSGSTGEPKGVPILKDNLLNFIKFISNLNPLNTYKNINVLNQASFSFDLSVADIYYSLCNGHTLVGLDKEVQKNYNGIFDVIKDNKINLMVVTPTFIKLCLLNHEFNSTNYKDLKCIYFCGEFLDKKVVNKLFLLFPNIAIINAYGPTEATSAVSGILITKDMLDSDKKLPVGEIDTSATDITIKDDEIILKGKSVFEGYLGDRIGGYYKEDNINCYKTGDLGYIEDNKLYCIGRKDNQIKYKGYRIELDDIESNINKIKGVIDSAVIVKNYDDNTIKTIIAFVVLDELYDEEYVRNELSKILPNYMIPKVIKKIDKLPINQNGKIDRKALKEL